jgi:predicted dinucleotide-utilizing enzyme
MNRKVRTAVVGCGKVAHLHAAALGGLPEAEFVAVTDANFERAGEFATRYRVRGYGTTSPRTHRATVLVETCAISASDSVPSPARSICVVYGKPSAARKPRPSVRLTPENRVV